MDASQRSAYLDGVCAADPVLRRRIDALLETHRGAGNFLETPIVSPFGYSGQTLGEAESFRHSEDVESVVNFLELSSNPEALGRLGHYEVMAILGAGGFGTVVRAFDEKLHRTVAIKIMSPLLAATSPARKRFLREARSSAGIRHENVVGLYAIEEQPIPFLVMEYVEGETLQQRLNRTGPLDPVDVLRIGLQIAQGLVAAHAMGRVHRDIKPANILLEKGSDRAKITDFGLARAADDASLTQSGVIAGTPLYMSPEQAQGVAVDPRADLFSLGSVMYVMCSGRPPFRAATTLAVLKRVAEDAARPIREIIPETPQWLCDIIAKLHAKKPEDRFQSAQELVDTLTPCLAELKLHGKTSPALSIMTSALKVSESATLPIVAQRPIRKRRWLVAALLAVVVGVGITESLGLTRLSGAVTRLFSREVPNDADRRAAEYALSVGATLMILEHSLGQERRLWPGNDVPNEPFDLRVVSLIGNQQVNDAGMDVFKGCKFLTNIDLERTKISASKILELRRALPDCKIEWDGDIKLMGSSPDRRAAEYVLSIGGVTQIKGGGLYRTADSRGALPNGEFILRAIYLNDNQKVNDDDIALLKDCHRLQALNLSGTKLSDAGMAHLKDSKTLGNLDVGGTQVSDVGLAHLKDVLSVAALTVSGTKVTDDGLAHVKYCRSLSYLDVGNTSVGDAGLAHFKENKNFSGLLLSRTRVTDKGLAPFKDCGHLVRLDLSDTDVGDLGLAHFKDCKSLADVRLSGSKIGDAGLIALKNCADLAFLELDRTQVGDAGLAHLKACKNLNHLSLAGSRVTDAVLDQLLGCPKLYTLNVRNTKISAAALKSFAAGLPTCRIECDAGWIEPTDNGDPDCRVAEWLARQSTVNIVTEGKEIVFYSGKKLPNPPFQLRRLRVAYCAKVTEETSPIFKGLRHLTHLEIINCKVADKTIVQFKECTHLKELSLQGTGVTDAGVEQLSHFTELQYVNLSQTAVTEAAARKLAIALPRCKIEWNGGIL